MKKLKVKYRIVVILFLLVSLVIGSCITYSLFHSSIRVNVNQELAQFVFDARNTDHIDLNLVGLTPGDSEDYYFSVTNSNNNKLSHVTLNYQITVKTLHTMPLTITLYDVTDGESQILQCDESYSRDANHYLICNSPVMEMTYENAVVDRYKITVDFPEQYNGVEYSDLVDSISVDISSWQKVS
ncbi:MAG: hypothetical protein IJ193_09515 [Bacilli bacterium]|nr:hypothetical protein [Bacilli bacterium]